MALRPARLVDDGQALGAEGGDQADAVLAEQPAQHQDGQKHADRLSDTAKEVVAV
ncbi:Uncharacterised protein [Bordetella pertussis]|nr:Uncharacterised protein [Bordetella pertussis]CPI66779.1 Uncharacterised protein [Bordetella pertussis]